MTRKSLGTRARLVVAACLALPFLSFGVWDAVLAVTAPFALPAGEDLPAAGRQNATACLLYGCAHSLSQSLQGDTNGWTADTAASPTGLRTDLAARLDALAAGGILDEVQRQALQTALDDPAHLTLTRYTLGSNLEQWTLERARSDQDPNGPVRGWPGLHFQAIFTAEGVPVLLDLQNGPAAPLPAWEELLTFCGLDGFSDWQPQTLNGYAGSHGDAHYSADACLYARLDGAAGLSWRLISMTPGEMEVFLAGTTG